jgi:hypothetical protein
MGTDTMTLDEALLWLNDRLGESVNVAVELDRGHVGAVVVEGEGTLEHWSEPVDPRTLAVPRDDLVGWYRAGETRFDLTDLAQARIELFADLDALRIELADGVALRVLEQAELPE